MDLPGAADGSKDADSLKNKTQSAEYASRPPADDSSRDNSDEEHDAREQDDSTDDDEDGDDEEDEEDEEPRLKYVYLTKCLPSLYRAGDATSAVLVAGDRMVQCPHYRKTGRAQTNLVEYLDRRNT
jgi:hypothetical protein